MDQVLNAATELAVLLSPHRVEAIADRIRATPAPQRDLGLHQLVGTPVARLALDRLLSSWEQASISGDIVAGILLGASHARQRTLQESTVELVWTGPTTPFVATRRTEQVLLEVIRRAKKELFLVSFVAYDISSIVEALNSASGRGVKIRILLESALNHGGSLSVDPVATMRYCVPSALLYAWIDRPPPFVDGRVHAKVAIADEHIAFLTSANLTGYALEKNMELGVLITGGTLPTGLHSHLHALIETKAISPV